MLVTIDKLEAIVDKQEVVVDKQEVVGLVDVTKGYSIVVLVMAHRRQAVADLRDHCMGFVVAYMEKLN